MSDPDVLTAFFSLNMLKCDEKPQSFDMSACFNSLRINLSALPLGFLQKLRIRSDPAMLASIPRHNRRIGASSR
jgi:hypothetical protein